MTKGQNMKTRLTLAVVIGSFLIISFARADVIGGYLNTQSKEIVVMFDALSTQKVLLGASLDAIKISGVQKRIGELYVVYPDGRFMTVARSFRDRNSLEVAAPTDTFDKIVYVDSRSVIVGGIGLAANEIQIIATANRLKEVSDASVILDPKRLKVAFDSVDLAAHSAAQAFRMRDDERRAIFTSTVGMTGGINVQHVVEGIVKSSDEDDGSAFARLGNILLKQEDSVITKRLLRGIDIISEGDNGGPGNGFVAEGDNGGPGNGYVAEGDNGGPGNGYVIHGWAAASTRAPNLMLPRFANACHGTMFYIF